MTFIYNYFGRVYLPRHGAHKARKVCWISRDGANNGYLENPLDPLAPRPTTLDFNFFIVFFYSPFIKFGNNIRSILSHRLRRWPNIG